MPVPIKPVREIEDNMPGVLVDGGFSAMGLSDLQCKMLGIADFERESAKKITIDARDAEILHEIWNSQEEERLAQSEDVKTIKMSIPQKIEDRDIIRMKTNGLIIGPDREISLTSRGEKVLKDKILSQPSMDYINRTKEKYEFEKEANTKRKLIKISDIK